MRERNRLADQIEGVRKLEQAGQDARTAGTEDPSLGTAAAAAQRVMRERTGLADQIEGVRKLEQAVQDALELVELAEAEGDAATADAAVADLQALATEAKRREIE